MEQVITQAELAELQALRAQVAAMRANDASKYKLSVTPKGTVKLAGTRQWGICLYANEWQVIKDQMPRIEEFVQQNLNTIAKK